MIAGPLFQTDRLMLRPLTDADTAAVFALTGDERVARFMRFSSHTSFSQARELIAEYQRGDAFAVCRRPSGDFLGVFALNPTASRTAAP